MEFEWDENKTNRILKNTESILLRQKTFLLMNAKQKPKTYRKDYSEDRKKIIGKAIDLILSAVYTMRCEVVRLISARAASRKELGEYFEKQQNDGKE